MLTNEIVLLAGILQANDLLIVKLTCFWHHVGLRSRILIMDSSGDFPACDLKDSTWKSPVGKYGMRPPCVGERSESPKLMLACDQAETLAKQVVRYVWEGRRAGGDDSFMQRPACQVSGWLILASDVGAGCEQEIRSPWRQVPSIRVVTPQPHAGGTGRDDESERGRSLLDLASKKCRWWMVGTCLDRKSSFFFFSPTDFNYVAIWELHSLNFESPCLEE